MASQKYYIGFTFYKEFEGEAFKGRVVSFDSDVGYFHVVYSDGDEEDLEEFELDKLRPAAGSNAEEEPKKKKAKMQPLASGAVGESLTRTSSSSKKKPPPVASLPKATLSPAASLSKIEVTTRSGRKISKIHYNLDCGDSHSEGTDTSYCEVEKKKPAAKKKKKISSQIAKHKGDNFTMEIVHTRMLKRYVSQMKKGVYDDTNNLVVSFPCIPRYDRKRKQEQQLPTKENVGKLIRAVGLLPGIKRAYVYNLTAREGFVEADAIAECLKGCRDKLCTIHIASPPDMDDNTARNTRVCLRLEEDSSLTRGDVNEVEFEVKNQTERFVWTPDHYMQINGGAPRYLYRGEGPSRLTSFKIVKIVEACPTLRELRFSRFFVLSNDLVTSLVTALLRQRRLEILLFCSNMGSSGQSAFLDMLRQHPSLKRFDVIHRRQDANDFLAKIADVLKSNNKVRSFYFDMPMEVDQTSVKALVSMAEQNTALIHFDILRDDFTSLERSVTRRKLGFYCRLNALGRGKFCSVSREEQCQILSSCRTDLSSLFAFLQMDPGLCEATS